MVSGLLTEMDGLQSKSGADSLFTIAATNMPWQLDPAILSRFEKQFYVPLPDTEARARVLEIHLQERGYSCEASMEKIVRHTRGYSGRELKQLCQEAVRLMMSEANPRIGQIVDQGQQALSNYQLKIQSITVANFNQAFKKVRPQTDAALLARYEDWNGRGG